MRSLLLIAFLITGASAAHAQSSKDLVGCWAMPTLKGEYLSLDSEGNFFFNDYREISRSFDQVFGTWKLKRDILILTYGQQKQLRFKLQSLDSGAWILSGPGRVRLFKAKPEDCESR